MEAPQKKDAAESAKKMEEEILLTQYGSHSTFEEALASVAEADRVKFLCMVHDPIKESCDEEISKRSQEALTQLNIALNKPLKPPYDPEVIEALLVISRYRVIPDLFPKMEQLTQTLRAKLANMQIDDLKTSIEFNMAIASISMQYGEGMKKDIEEECKSHGLSTEDAMRQALPMLASDLSFYSDLTHLHGLKIKDNFPSDAVDIEKASNYISTSNDFSKKFLSSPMNPQIAMVYPNIVEVFLFNKTKLEFVQVECFIADFLAKYPKEPTDKEKQFIRLLMEEVYCCQKVQEKLLVANQQYMEMMEEMMSGGMGFPGMPPLSESQEEQLNKLFDPKNADMLKELFANMDMEKLQEMMPMMNEMMGQMGAQGGLPPNPFGMGGPGGMPPNPFGMGGQGGLPPNPFGMGGPGGMPPNPFGMGGPGGMPPNPFNTGNKGGPSPNSSQPPGKPKGK